MCSTCNQWQRSMRIWSIVHCWTVNTAGYIVGRHMTDSFQDPTLAFPALQGPQHRTTLVKGDNGKWQILELNEPLRLLVSLDAKFHELQGNRSTITLITPGEKDPYIMGFKFEEDGPMELQAEHHDDDGENVLLAPEDDVQGVGDVAQPADVPAQELGGGRIVVQPQRDDQIEVNGETLTAESSLANLRAACRTYGISTSGSKSKVFRKLVEHQKGLQMEAVFHASRDAMDSEVRIPRAPTLAEPPDESVQAQHRLTHCLISRGVQLVSVTVHELTSTTEMGHRWKAVFQWCRLTFSTQRLVMKQSKMRTLWLQ